MESNSDTLCVYPEMEFLDMNLSKTLQSLFYWRILQENILYSSFKLHTKKIQIYVLMWLLQQPSYVTVCIFCYDLIYDGLLSPLKVPSGQIGSAWEWYHWKAL